MQATVQQHTSWHSPRCPRWAGAPWQWQRNGLVCRAHAHNLLPAVSTTLPLVARRAFEAAAAPVAAGAAPAHTAGTRCQARQCAHTLVPRRAAHCFQQAGRPSPRPPPLPLQVGTRASAAHAPIAGCTAHHGMCAITASRDLQARTEHTHAQILTLVLITWTEQHGPWASTDRYQFKTCYAFFTPTAKAATVHIVRHGTASAYTLWLHY